MALAEIPTLRMIVTPAAELGRRARKLARKIGEAEVVPGESSVGGGAFPEASLPTSLVAMAAESCEAMLDGLRAHTPPIIARAKDGRVIFDVRTMYDEDFPAVADAVRAARG